MVIIIIFILLNTHFYFRKCIILLFCSGLGPSDMYIRLSGMLSLMRSPLHSNRNDYMTEKHYSNSFWTNRFYNYIILYRLDELNFLVRLVS